MVLRTFSHRATFVPACQHNPCFAHLGSCDEVALMTNLERFPVHRNNPCDDFGSPHCGLEAVLCKSQYVLPNCCQLGRPGGT